MTWKNLCFASPTALWIHYGSLFFVSAEMPVCSSVYEFSMVNWRPIGINIPTCYNISEHSTRHRQRTTSPKSHRHTRKTDKSQAPIQPDGTPPPPYSQNGAGLRRDPAHTSQDPPLESRGESGRRGAAVQNGDAVDGQSSGYLISGGGLFGRHQTGSHQVIHRFVCSFDVYFLNGSV